MKSRRQIEMESYILTQGSATMEELRDHFGISMNTVRRDVAELIRPGYITKVYGGVKAEVQPSTLVPYAVRSRTPSREKQMICLEAAKMVRDGDILFIDSGTTTVHIMEALKDKNITVITNNIEAMMLALEHENIRLIVVPGEIHRKTHSITGEDSAAFLSTMNTNIAFMAATGVSYGGVTNSSPLEYAIKRAAVQHTERAVLLVSANKFGQTSLLTYAQLKDFERVITDDGIPPEWQKHLASLGVEVDIVEQ
jgi:DeoR family myo-inositol catabolism operon transcriptional repressor